MSFSTRTMKVNGHEVIFNVDDELGIAADIGGDMDKVASQMGFWGNVCGAAEAEKIRADAHYRHWRAKQAQAALSAQPNLAEWKVGALIEANPTFLKLKEGIAEAASNHNFAEKTFRSLEKKANQLQSKGAKERAEYAATGMTTPTEPRTKRPSPVEAEPSQDERVSAVKSIFKNRKAKK